MYIYVYIYILILSWLRKNQSHAAAWEDFIAAFSSFSVSVAKAEHLFLGHNTCLLLLHLHKINSVLILHGYRDCQTEGSFAHLVCPS